MCETDKVVKEDGGRTDERWERDREGRKTRNEMKEDGKKLGVSARVFVRYTSIYIKNRSTATIRDLFSNKEFLSDPRWIMWVTKARVGFL